MATIGERIITALGGVTSKRITEATARAYESGFSDGNDDPQSGGVKKGGQGYRRYTTKSLRDFTKISRETALETVWTLWQSSPIAKRVMTIKRDHIIGRGSAPVTDDAELGELLTAFWERNKLNKRAGEFALQLFLLGEQCYPAFVRNSDGRASIGYFDTKEISEVITHPDNSMEPMAVVLKATTGGSAWISDMNSRVYRIIQEGADYVDGDTVYAAKYPGRLVTWEQANLQPWEMVMLKEYGRSEYDGSVFFTKVNALSNQSRGNSDLLQVADWIDQAEETLFALGEREQLRNFFAFFVKLIGADAEEVQSRSRKLRENPPGTGTVLVMNDQEEWQPVTFDLGQSGSIESFRTQLGFILGGMGIPVHWYGFGDDSNRATAAAQGSPTVKSLEYDQGIVKDLFMTMLQFQIDQAVIAGNGKYDDAEYNLPLPEISSQSTSDTISLFKPLAESLIAAVDSGLNTKETAVTAWAKLLAEFGIDIDPALELEAIAQQKEKSGIDDEQGTNDAISSMFNQLDLDSEMSPENIRSAKGLNGAQVDKANSMLKDIPLRLQSPEVVTELLLALGIDATAVDRMVNAAKAFNPSMEQNGNG